MPLVLESPTVCRLPLSIDIDDVRRLLAYKDSKIQYELGVWRRVSKLPDDKLQSHWFVKKHGLEALNDKIRQLASEVNKTCVFQDASGYWTHAGLAQRLSEKYGEPVIADFPMPGARAIKLAHQPYEPRPYQQGAMEALLAARHGAVSLPTGSGKSLVINRILLALGLPAVIVTPTLSIANQLYSDMVHHFGVGKVGKFFGGKKESSKHFVVAVSKSLMMIEKGSEHEEKLRAKPVVAFDECHLIPAESVSKIAVELLSEAPYRFSFSGTPERHDGLDLVLEGIIGRIVYEMSLEQAVDGGYLAEPNFVQFMVYSDSSFYSTDAIKMNREHLHANPLIYPHVANLVHKGMVKGYKPLVLIDEVSQFPRLYPFIKELRVGFAHGGLNAVQRKEIPEEFFKSDPMELVSKFDAGELDILVGTSCIGIGTDIKTPTVIYDLIGLTSENRIRQSIGRGTRKPPGKNKFNYVDYGIDNIGVLRKHAEERRRIFDSVFPRKQTKVINVA